MSEYALRWKVGTWGNPWQWRAGFASPEEADLWRRTHTSAFTWEILTRELDSHHPWRVVP